jgi:acyl carrier protein
MDIKNFIEKFAEQFENTSSDSFIEETKFRELSEWDSLIALSVMAMIDENYNVRITGDEMRDANTIADLYRIIKAKQ